MFAKDAKGKTIGFEIEEPYAETVRLIYRWYVYGDETGKRLALYGIANKLIKLKIPTPAEVRGIEKIRVHKRTANLLTYRSYA